MAAPLYRCQEHFIRCAISLPIPMIRSGTGTFHKVRTGGKWSSVSERIHHEGECRPAGLADVRLTQEDRAAFLCGRNEGVVGCSGRSPHKCTFRQRSNERVANTQRIRRDTVGTGN